MKRSFLPWHIFMNQNKTHVIWFFVLLLGALFGSSTTSAQVSGATDDQRTPIPGEPHDYVHLLSETVDPSNGSLNINITIPMPQGRGFTLPFGFNYSSNGVTFIKNDGQSFYEPVTTAAYGLQSVGGWSYGIPTISFTRNYITKALETIPVEYATCYFFNDFVFQSPDGGRHSLNLSFVPPSQTDCTTYFPSYTSSAPGTGGDTYLGASLSGSPTSPTVDVTDVHGNIWRFEPNFAIPAHSRSQPNPDYIVTNFAIGGIEDRNGNEAGWTASTGLTYPIPTSLSFTGSDTLQREVSVSAFAANATVTVPGLPSPYATTWETITTGFSAGPTTRVDTDGNCTVVYTPHTVTSTPVIKSIGLPNGQSYQFTYDPTYGTINQITYPNGGSVSYTWGWNAQAEAIAFPDSEGSSDCKDLYGTLTVQSRTVKFDGVNTALTQTFLYSTSTWNNSQVPPLWTSKQTTVTTSDAVRGTSFTTTYNYLPGRPPAGPLDLAFYGSQIPLENTIVYKDTNGSTLKTLTKGWTFGQNGGPDVLLCQVQTLDNGLISGEFYLYSSTAAGASSLVTNKKEYDFGLLSSASSCSNQAPPATAPAGVTPSRETITTYQAFTGAPGTILDKPCKVVTNGATGSQAAETDYLYDGGTTVCGTSGNAATTAVSGATDHDETSFSSTSTTPRGNVTKRISWLNGGTSPFATYAYDETGQLLSVTDGCGNATCNDMTGTNHKTTYSYADSFSSGTPPGNTNAYLTTMTDALGHTWTYTYGYADGQLTQSTDPNNQNTQYKYGTIPTGCSFTDKLDRLTEIDYPDGGQTTNCYDDVLLAPSVTSTTLISSTPSVNLSTTTIMDGLGHIVQKELTTDPDGTTHTVSSYDGIGRPYQSWNATRCTTPTTNCGTEPTWGFTTQVYDALGRMKTVTEPDGSTVVTTYDQTNTKSTGTCVTVTDETGLSRQSCADGLGRVTGVWEDPSGKNYETDYTYDALNNLLSVTQKGGSTVSTNWRVRNFQYDSLSRLTNTSSPESGSISYTYDANGNVATRIAPQADQTASAQTTTSYTYDVLNRKIRVAHTNPSNANASWAYDGTAITGCPGIAVPTLTSPTNLIGRRSSMCSQESTSSFSYDQMGRMIAEAHSIGLNTPVTFNTGYTYYKDGSVNKLTYPSGDVVTYTVGGAGRVTGIKDTNSTFVSAPSTLPMYAPHGALLSVTQGSGITTNNIYNDRLQPILLSAGPSTGPVFSVCYDFHAKVAINNPPCQFTASTTGDNGNVRQYLNNVDSTRSAAFTYDSLNRITQANTVNTTSANCWGESYTIDPWGNMTNIAAAPGMGGSCVSESLNAAPASTANQLTGYCYDTAGNLLQSGTCPSGSFTPTYWYDAENRMANPTATYSYFYDADGSRIRKAASATLGTMYWSGPTGEYLMETNGSGTISEEYVYFNGQRIARIDRPSGTVHYYFSDHLGSTSTITDPTGTVIQEQCYYYPYGATVTCTGSDSNHYLFTGKERDSETGLDNFDFRYYFSSLGRFMKPDDDSAQDPGSPQSWNLYSYVMNQPTFATDPDGHDCIHINPDTKVFEGWDSGDCNNTTEEMANSGIYVDGTIDSFQYNRGAGSLDYSYTDGSGAVGAGTITGVVSPQLPAVNDPGMIPGMLGPGDLILFGGVKMPSYVTELFGKLFGSLLGRGAEAGTEASAEAATERVLASQAARALSREQRDLLKRFFGTAMRGAQSRAADFQIPAGLTRETLEVYKRVAQAAIDANLDSSGVQAARLVLVNKALEQLH